jgi:hypothetical protein
MNLFPFMHREFFGLSFTLNSLHTHFVLTYAIPIFGSIVVNGYGAIFTGTSVAAAKNVDLPVFGFPTIPQSIFLPPIFLIIPLYIFGG